MTIALFADSHLSREQEEVLRDLWVHSTGLWGSAWNSPGGYLFPETREALEDIRDNDRQISTRQITGFVSALRHAYRCGVCGTAKDVEETGTCIGCADADVDVRA